MESGKVYEELNLKNFLLPAIGSLIFSSLLSIISGHKYDLNIWLKTGECIVKGIDIYAPQDHIGYPPLWAFWCLISYFIYRSLGFYVWLFFIKLPLIVLIPLLSYELFKLTKSYQAYIVALCLSPIYLVSSVWGQINIIISYLLIKFLNSFDKERHIVRSSSYLSISLAVKPLHVIFIPYILMLYKGWIKRLIALIILLTVPAASTLISILFFKVNLTNFINTLYYQPMRLELTGYGLMNFWSFLALHPNYHPNVIVSQIWIPAILLVTYLIYKKGVEVVRGLCLILFTYILTYPWVSEATVVDALTLLIPLILNYNVNIYILTFFFTSTILFNLMNGGLSLFDYLLNLLSKWGLTGYLGSEFYNMYGMYIWMVRGIMGLICSIAAMLVIIDVFHLRSQVIYRQLN